MNPLLKIEEAERSRRLPSSISKKIKKRIEYVEDGVAKIESASGLKYPSYYIEPNLPLSSSQIEVYQLGVIYARTIPIETFSGLEILVQLSAPLVAFGLKTTIRAVLAHEFLHYIEFMRRFNKLDIVSDSLSTSLFESLYSDYEKLFEPKLIFKDRRLVKLVDEKFSNGLNDKRLHEKTLKQWIERGLPKENLSPESNILRVPVSLILNMKIDPLLKLKLEELERKGYERN
ncbi:MAG: hypothetical protein L6N95_02065 [Candidatus Methylarchaceae archaeon HK01B]|nr:hypothetical protein [Candidatus Methylarchaceae archaeon HK01M]MCP8312613.1 hypothetical protein [Candidatus Methylarchaceae archaeon HK02M1]MCP8318599.1 hypothetical protein [Candidatus Methylarchaceae archaeon HK01B]